MYFVFDLSLGHRPKNDTFKEKLSELKVKLSKSDEKVI